MKDKVTTTGLSELKRRGVKIAALTAYDCQTAGLLEEAGVDIVLVGDSVGMVKLGYENTIPVTLDDILHHVKAVGRGLGRAQRRPLLVADMPYLTYELDPTEAARNAGRLIKEGGAEAVKLEGGMEIAPTVKELDRVHVPVMGHLGLTPQAIHRLGGYKIQGRKADDAEKMVTDAKVLEAAGVFALVLECVPADLARVITRKLSIPVIGIGAGPHCDGQILVTDDMLGLTGGAPFSFVKRYCDLRPIAAAAAAQYCREVREGVFPGPEHHKGTPSKDSKDGVRG
ncbi:MAG: 3-methyl-2-oxobutanoate hydroxymethyltransferase [Elusimicrobia bacterium]|nr:3-methyl-2-oxobutanoate hydroxymethyltransferase [Elusimicrobiota bacterium]